MFFAIIIIISIRKLCIIIYYINYVECLREKRCSMYNYDVLIVTGECMYSN